MRGVDIYRYQTVTSYAELARQVGFVWVKLTDGKAPAVVRGDAQVNGCRAVGLPTGGYHYAQPGNPEQQASVFLGELRRLDALDIAAALDLEDPFTPNNQAREFGIRFCRAIAAAGVRPAVYMSASWAGVLRPDTWDIPGLVIWIAAYGANNGTRNPAAVTRYYTGRMDVHQYTSAGTIPGIRGLVDVNEAFTDIRNTTKQEDDVELTDKITMTRPTDGREITVTVGDILKNLFLSEFYGSANEPWKGAGSRQLLIQAAAGKQTLDLSDDDIAQLADALVARGVAGATPDQVADALRDVFHSVPAGDQEPQL